MLKKTKANHRIFAVILASVIVITAIAVFPNADLSANAASLPYIEKLKNQLVPETGRAFSILEIGNTGIGYYMAGSEPESLKNNTTLKALANKPARESYVNNTWQTSTAAALAGFFGADENAYPLDIVNYEEGYYWQSAEDYPYILLLDNYEKADNIAGIVTPEANGAYKAEYTYTLGSSGGFVLSGGYLKAADSAPADDEAHYYYKPDFEALQAGSDTFDDGTPMPDGTPLYTFAGGEYIFVAYKAPGVLNPSLGFTGTYSDYYAVKSLGAPNSMAYNTSLGVSGKVYELAEAEVIPENGGYLSRTVKQLTLVLAGGDVSFTPDTSSADEYTINYNMVRYTGGIENHNWFSRFVLDAEDDEIQRIKYNINSLKASQLAGINLAAYDLVVIGENVVHTDFPQEFLDKAEEAGNTLPIIFVNSTKDLAEKFSAGLAALMDIYGNNFVSNNFYFYNPAPLGFSGMLTVDFYTDFAGSLTPAQLAGFAEVTDEINSENDLRAITDEEKLPVVLSIATSIRHILNQREPRAARPLTQLRVLEVQPLYITGKTDSTKYLTWETVRDWLPDLKITGEDGIPHALGEEDIVITRMSTAEFNGRIEDLNENYELIYIGDSRNLFTLSGADTNFADNTMDKLLYYNIGDLRKQVHDETYHVRTKSLGLMDTDWTNASKTTILDNDYNTTLRLPGNDISIAKKDALTDFVNAGYPVVFAGDLVTIDTASGLNGISYTVEIENTAGNTLTATAKYYSAGGTEYATIGDLKTAVSSSEDIRGIFEWHYVDENGADTIVQVPLPENATTASTDSYVVNPASGGEYYCVYQLMRPEITTESGTPVTENAAFGTAARSTSAIALVTGEYIQVSGLPEQTSFYTLDGVSIQLTLTALPLNKTSDKIDITANAIATPAGGAAFSYNWYRADSELDTGTAITSANQSAYSVTPTAGGGYYYCVIDVDAGASNGEIHSRRIHISSFSQTGGIELAPGTLKKGFVIDAMPNEEYIDRWTNLSAFMQTALKRENTFNRADIESTDPAVSAQRRASLKSFISISKPLIIFEDGGIPQPYVTDDYGNMSANVAGRDLSYSFKISDPADPTPAATTYNVRLYIDANSSGLYTEEEVISADVFGPAGRISPASGRVYSLKADTAYRLEAVLPADMVGIVPWKLEVIKNSADGRDTEYFHGSQICYTRVEPSANEEKIIRVLQIVGYDAFHTTFPDRGTTVVLEANPLYRQYTDKDAVKDFDIKLNTIRNDGTFYQHQSGAGVNAPYDGPVYYPESVDDSEPYMWAPTDPWEKIYDEINYYDMLVIGFADCYEGVEENLALAIMEYIKSGKAVLFTHDTTSFINVPRETKLQNGNYSYNQNAYWGYYFNSILRPALGLDYYGIVDPVLGDTLKSQTDSFRLSAQQISELKAHGYNIAYKPNSVTGMTEEKTQGFATYFAAQNDPDYRPGNVTQINSGQITTYPYNINLKGFQGAPQGAGSILSVAPTHFQYYSLNLNHEDLVVWYCLADGPSAGAGSLTDYYHTNDASNGYYIYTMGNITYSGVGHDSHVTADEAKLFVNTMIAAYRSTSMNLEVIVKDKDNKKASYQYFLSDMANDAGNEIILTSTNPNDEMYAAYFSFIDSNINAGFGVSYPKYYYTTGSQLVTDTALMTPIDGLDTYNTAGGIVSAIERSELYHFYIPADVVKLLETEQALRVYAEVTTYFDNGESTRGIDSVELRKIGLLGLE